MLEGVINIYKEKGYTSHDVVAKLRGILKQKKIGHTGTLDPDAEGVLLVCLGKATKLCDMLTDRDKTYRCTMLLGRETDTQDTTGAVLSERPVTASEEEVRLAVNSFVGNYSQIPPMYSALKVGGKKLYELAREGKEVERAARPVMINSIEIEEIVLPRVVMSVSCSKGTYIRTLCHDIGRKLGCGACMEHLLRTQVGRFGLEGSLTLDQVEQRRDEGTLNASVLPIDEMFEGYPRVSVDEAGTRLVRNGNQFAPEFLIGSQPEQETPVRVYDCSGTFIGIYEYRRDRQQYHPLKIFFGGN